VITLEGLIPAIVTPMTAEGDVDEAALRGYVRWIADQGPVALAVNADTGEGPHLSSDERRHVLEVVKEETAVPCVVGLNGPSTRSAVQQAHDLARAGADALLVFPIPAYLSAPLDPRIPVEYHRAVADAGLPLVLFQLQPALGGVIFESDTLRQLAAVDGVVALKEASFDARAFAETERLVASLSRPLTLLTGNDNFILESFLLGAAGALIGFGTVMVREQVAMIDAWKAGHLDEARRLGRRVQRLSDAVFAHPVGAYRTRLKECLVLLGVLEHAHVRAPLLALDDGERAELHKVLVEVGLL
jgi:4-hydroxy-tetrahydrodipicolinate synthase